MARPSAIRIWVGTRKGAFAFTSKDRKKWDCAGPFFAGQEVHHVAQDPREPKRHYAAVGNAWFGPHLHASTDSGKTWQISEKGLEVKGITGKTWQISEKGMELKDLPDATLKRIWHIAPGAADDPGAVYLGADPGVLFRSGDNGANWEMVPGLCNHSTREKWNPGAGGMMVHSIQCLGKGRLIVGISAAGAFRSSDAGKTWSAVQRKRSGRFWPRKISRSRPVCPQTKSASPQSRFALPAKPLWCLPLRFYAERSGPISRRASRRDLVLVWLFPRLKKTPSLRFLSFLPRNDMFPKANSAWLAAAMGARRGSF